MQIKCDTCGAVAETIMPETAKDGDIEHSVTKSLVELLNGDKTEPVPR